ncbi:SDR family oxidoreductase [Halorussus caseinilyticus]|uniref:SDR family oxidoreductase n=1 Tax=Halorussus caseinilyticus TaxID=3034025 RepID=A0ABD5WJE0_9EURY|nr:SDR family oxidoreductase [Halorussus sp. DT72]
MSQLLTDKTAVVTGAASGNGRAIARRFAEEGADVVIADVQTEPREGGRPTHEKIEAETDARATFVECDVSERADVKRAVEAADEFGGLDVMVNNAGISGPEKSFVDLEQAEFEKLMHVNLNGVFYGCQEAALKMIAQGEGGSIINMSSAGGLVGVPDASAYSTAKGGVRLLTYSLAAELGEDGIRVNTLHPGVIETAMTKRDGSIIGSGRKELLKRGDVSFKQLIKGSVRGEIIKRHAIPLSEFGDPKHVADAAVFLASDLSEYISAESIAVDGGMVNTA